MKMNARHDKLYKQRYRVMKQHHDYQKHPTISCNTVKDVFIRIVGNEARENSRGRSALSLCNKQQSMNVFLFKYF